MHTGGTSPALSEQFWLQTNASKQGVRAVLNQAGEDRRDHPIAFFSRRLLPRELNYFIRVKEYLAIINALNHLEV